MKVENGKVILAEGEVTGHAHRVPIGENIEVHEDFFAVKEGSATVTHEEHGAIELPPGDYSVGIVRETDHLRDEVRNVAD